MNKITTTLSGSNVGVLTLILTVSVCSLLISQMFIKLRDGSEDRNATRGAASESTSVHLPTKCRPYYNDGTDNWINCMGVGKK